MFLRPGGVARRGAALLAFDQPSTCTPALPKPLSVVAVCILFIRSNVPLHHNGNPISGPCSTSYDVGCGWKPTTIDRTNCRKVRNNAFISSDEHSFTIPTRMIPYFIANTRRHPKRNLHKKKKQKQRFKITLSHRNLTIDITRLRSAAW